MNNSIEKSSYSTLIEEVNTVKQVKLLNPLSKDMDSMRQNLLFSSLENIAYNINRKSSNLSFYEFGKTYNVNGKEFFENKKIAISACGNTKSKIGMKKIKKRFFWIKNMLKMY